MNENAKKAVVALSGGIDSSVAALLLKQQGYKVIGLTGKMMESDFSEVIVQNAKNVADSLGIEHYVYDASKIFREKVVDYFEKSYAIGQTPNPCIVCNQFVKWGELFDFAVENLNADVFATGHYANIINNNGTFNLYPAADEHKDQLYFLCRLTQKQLSKTLFPLSALTKSEVREIATKYNLPTKSSKESQDICFIHPPMTTKKYLIEKFGQRKGDFVDNTSGKVCGKHDGCYLYTIGQRKGIGIAAPTPLYVIKIDAQKNIVYVGRQEDNYKLSLEIRDLNIIDTALVEKSKIFDAFVKIRYNMSARKARVEIRESCARLTFYEPVNSVTSGQAGVIYDMFDGHLIAGGIVV